MKKLTLIFSTALAALLLLAPAQTAYSKGSKIRHLSNPQKELGTAVKKGNVILKVYAPWCPPCRKMAPIVSKLAAEFSDDVTFVEVNLDSFKGIKQRLDFRTIPRFFYFKNGKKIGSSHGSMSKSGLRSEIRKRFKLA